MLSTTMGRIRSRLDKAGVTAQTFSAIADIPATTFGRALSGMVYLGAEKENRFDLLSARVVEIVEALAPLSIRNAELESLKHLVESKRTADEIRGLVSQMFSEEQING